MTNPNLNLTNPILNREYEHYYNITLLDDIHNYFPDILYTNRFSNNPLVQYIQEETENIFNLYSIARRRHTNNRQTNSSEINDSQTTTTTVSSQQPIQRTGRSAGYTSRLTVPRTVPTEQIRMTFDFNDNLSDIESANALLNLLNGVLNPVALPQTRNFMEPVVVRATEQQINSASSIIEVTNSNENCSICQESLVSNSERVRRLNNCQHMFHDSCIIEWFNRNVRCPVCRHDIRNV